MKLDANKTKSLQGEEPALLLFSFKLNKIKLKSIFGLMEGVYV